MTTPPDIQAALDDLRIGLDMLAHGLHVHNSVAVRKHAATVLVKAGFANHTTDAALALPDVQSHAPEQCDRDRVIRMLAEALDDCMAVVSDRPAGGRMLTKKRILEAGQTALSDPAVVKVMGV